MFLPVLLMLTAAASFGAKTMSNTIPFVVTASTGPAVGSHIIATVTRSVGGTNVTLPAALVPALKPGDVVDVDFPDYRRPPSSVNYHVNVAFITEAAPQRWFFDHGTAADRLFQNGRSAKHPPANPTGRLHFVYGSKYYRGIPIFTIIPEDAKTRGVDGVRDYVNAHPSDFVAMSESTNDAVDKYSFMSNFLASLANGSIDPASSRERVESIAQGLGVPAATVDGCYTAGGSQAYVSNCIQQAIGGVVHQTNFAAPTQAQFLGGVAGAAEPLVYAPYIGALLTVWNIFVHTGHLEYEYLPATIALADPSTAKRDELLLGLKVPTIRPPAAASDVMFFTIGDPQAEQQAPTVVNEASANGVCERTSRFSVPLHFDHTSRYVHDAALVVTPDGRPAYTISLDPRSLDAPVIDRSRFAGSTDGGYTLSLSARFGFDQIVQPARVAMRLVLPHDVPWTIAAVAHHPPIAGQALDVIASSAAAGCLSHAELQEGSAPAIPLTVTALDDERVELRGALTNLPAGPAQIRLYQDDPLARRQIEATESIAIKAPPAEVDAKSAVASIGDAFVRLAGSGFEGVRGLFVNGATYLKESHATATSACFDGPPLDGAALVVGQQITAQLVTDDGTLGEVFPLALEVPRPTLAESAPATPAGDVHFSTTPLSVTLEGGIHPLPRRISVRIRKAFNLATPCEALRADPTAVMLPATAVQPRSPNLLAVAFRPDMLHERAYGTLEMQVVDTESGLGSAWLRLPGTFVRAPDVTQITCLSKASSTCKLYGSGLTSIDAIADATGTFSAPDRTCPPTDKGVACVYVPRLAHYVLRLVDGGTPETLPDSLVPPASP